MKPYIQPTIETIPSPTPGILDSIGIHRSIGLDEDAANTHNFDTEADPDALDEYDDFFGHDDF